MYKEAKGVVTSYLLYLWLLLLVTLCILLSSEASTYYNSYSHPAAVQMRARPYYAVPHANHPPNNVEAYPMPARAVSSYAAPLIVMSANYEATPVNVPLTSTNKPVVISSTESEIEPIISNNNNSEEIDTSTYYSENNNADDYVNTEVSLLVPADAATTNWVLETSRGDDSHHYEGTTNAPKNAPVYLPTLTSSI
jgi:hypothetical protein